MQPHGGLQSSQHAWGRTQTRPPSGAELRKTKEWTNLAALMERDAHFATIKRAVADLTTIIKEAEPEKEKEAEDTGRTPRVRKRANKQTGTAGAATATDVSGNEPVTMATLRRVLGEMLGQAAPTTTATTPPAPTRAAKEPAAAAATAPPPKATTVPPPKAQTPRLAPRQAESNRTQEPQGRGQETAETWAVVTRRTPTRVNTHQSPPRKVMPKSIEDRQVTVRTGNSCLADRSPPETVRLINLELGTGAATAANRLPSGDTRVMMTPEAKARATADRAWVSKVFPNCSLAVPAYCVRAAGMQLIEEAEAHTRATQENSLKSLEMVRMFPCPEPPWRKRTGAAICLLYMTDMEEANRLVAGGLVFGCSWYPAKVYCDDANVRQCSKCLKYGHSARGCGALERCHKCGSGTHKVAACVKSTKCVNCGGAHGARNKKCPAYIREAKEARQRLKEAPKRFAGSATTQTPGKRAPPETAKTSSPAKAVEVNSTDTMEIDPPDTETETALAPETATSKTAPAVAPKPATSETALDMEIDPPDTETETALAPEIATSKTALAVAPEPTTSETALAGASETATTEIALAPDTATSETALVVLGPTTSAGAMAMVAQGSAAPETATTETAPAPDTANSETALVVHGPTTTTGAMVVAAEGSTLTTPNPSRKRPRAPTPPSVHIRNAASPTPAQKRRGPGRPRGASVAASDPRQSRLSVIAVTPAPPPPSSATASDTAATQDTLSQ